MEKVNKYLFVGIVAILILSLGIVSATTSSVFSIKNITAPTSVLENTTSFTFTFNITYNGSSESRDFSFSDSTSSIGTVSIPSVTGLNGTKNESRLVTGTVTGFNNRGGNSLTVRINASSGSIRDDESTFTVQITDVNVAAEEFCRFGEKGTLDISDFTINNLGNGDEDNWEPLDKIELEVEIENTDNDDDVQDVLVEIKIMNGDDDVTSDFDIKEEEIDLGRINNDDQETATFIIEEVPADLDEDTYRIFIKAYSDGDEDKHCTSRSGEFDNSQNSNLYHEIEYTRDEDVAVVVRDQDVSQNILASCGDENVEVTFPVYNIGTDKEEKVLVQLFNKELGINEFEVIDDLNSGKRKDVSFLINIPEDLSKDLYNLEITTYFDYDKDEDELEIFSYDANSEEDLDENFQTKLEILDCAIPEPSITAKLSSSTTTVGEELIVTSTIKNNADKETEFLISITDFESWADLTSEETQNVKLKAGESKEMTIKLIPKESGVNTFKINAITEGETFDQSVSVNISEKEGLFKGVSNTAVYLISGIVILLVLILLTLIIRSSRRSKRKEFSDLA